MNVSSLAIPLFWECPCFANHSFSIVTRETCLALLRRSEVDLTLFANGFRAFDPADFPEYAPLVASCTENKWKAGRPELDPRPIFVRLGFPLNKRPPPRSTWVVYHPWEYTRLPLASVQVLLAAKEVWTTSQFCVNAFVASGVPAEKIQIIPNGVDLAVFKPEGATADLPTSKPFRFLYVGGTIYRKGLDLLLEAYRRTFTAADPVSLVVKDYGVAGIYPVEKGAQLLADFRQNAAHPEVVHLTGIRSKAEMAALYRSCDVYVSSYRGEGFCLPALEAMACGRPVIVTKGGATDDFVTDAVGWRIPAPLRPAGNTAFYMPVEGQVELAEPNIDELAGLLRAAFEDRAERQARGAAGAKVAQAWSWDAAADKIVARCKVLAGSSAALAVR